MPEQSHRPEDCVEEFVLKHENRLYRTAVAILGNQADAEDIVQEVFVIVMEKCPSFDSPQHEAAWLIRVTVNLCKSRLRSSWWRKTVPLLKSYPAQTNEQHYLMETILSLPAKYRIVIHLFYYEGYTTEEIAEIIGQRGSTVRSQLTRARQKLKAILKEEML